MLKWVDIPVLNMNVHVKCRFIYCKKIYIYIIGDVSYNRLSVFFPRVQKSVIYI